MSPEGWAALAAVVGVVVAIEVAVSESKQSRFSEEIDIMSKLDTRFETPEFRATRSAAAKWLLDERPSADVVDNDSVKRLSNFFETLAYLHRKAAVSTESVWHYFGSWLLSSYNACNDYIDRCQQGDSNVYSDFAALHSAVLQCEREKRNYVRTEEVVSAEDVTAFLKEESKLPV